MSKFDGKILDVYEDNMQDEIRILADTANSYDCISIDTEFPGIVYTNNSNGNSTNGGNSFNLKKDITSIGNSSWKATLTANELSYQNIKLNVDNLKMIQLGITLANENGDLPEEISTWQFNFKFDLKTDAYQGESIQLLELAGINFPKFRDDGIDVESFAEHFISSGVPLNEKIKWITYHGVYDFAYLMKSLSNISIPDTEQGFLEMLGVYFPIFYDVRYLVRNISWVKSGLSKIAYDMDIKRIGESHQAGSDSLITSKLFFKLRDCNYEQFDVVNDCNKLFGFSAREVGGGEMTGNGEKVIIRDVNSTSNGYIYTSPGNCMMNLNIMPPATQLAYTNSQPWGQKMYTQNSLIYGLRNSTLNYNSSPGYLRYDSLVRPYFNPDQMK